MVELNESVDSPDREEHSAFVPEWDGTNSHIATVQDQLRHPAGRASIEMPGMALETAWMA